MVYTSINWQNQGPPAVSAENLNHMDQAILDAHEQLERLAYDVYNLYQEQYYTGNSPVSPSKGAAKTVVFDTSSAPDTYNTAGSTVMFATDRITAGYQDQAYQFPVAAIDYPFNGFYKESSGVYGVPSNLLAQDYTYGGFQNASSRQHYPIRLDLGSPKFVTGLKWYGYRSSTGNLEEFALYYLKNDGTYDRYGGHTLTTIIQRRELHNFKALI
ncbi:MAG TPA: hypothetical protein VNM45_02115 [Bacillus sp. (in: firmicutes)]|nr:hypothetical protein [Bacillus sp. (in: firmicutes)]